MISNLVNGVRNVCNNSQLVLFIIRQDLVSIFLDLFLPSYSSSHSRMRSKRLRTTEEPVGLDGSSTLNSSKRKGLGGPPVPKVRKSAAGTCKKEENEKEKKAEPKHNQIHSSVQLSGKRSTDQNGRYLQICILLHLRTYCSILTFFKMRELKTLYMYLVCTYHILDRSLQTDVCGQGKSS